MTFTKFARTDLGITVRDLATLSGLTPSEVSLIENGRLKPTDYQLAKLAAALGITPRERLLREVSVADFSESQAVPA